LKVEHLSKKPLPFGENCRYSSSPEGAIAIAPSGRKT